MIFDSKTLLARFLYGGLPVFFAVTVFVREKGLTIEFLIAHILCSLTYVVATRKIATFKGEYFAMTVLSAIEGIVGMLVLYAVYSLMISVDINGMASTVGTVTLVLFFLVGLNPFLMLDQEANKHRTKKTE